MSLAACAISVGDGVSCRVLAEAQFFTAVSFRALTNDVRKPMPGIMCRTTERRMVAAKGETISYPHLILLHTFSPLEYDRRADTAHRVSLSPVRKTAG